MALSFRKTILLEALLIALLVAGYFSADILSFLNQKNVEYTQPSDCSLNEKECRLALKDGSILLASLEPKILPPLQAAKFTVKNDGADSAKAVIRGLNMEMGIYEKTFQKLPNGSFELSTMLPSCSIDMKWQIDVIVSKNGKEYGGGFILWSKN